MKDSSVAAGTPNLSLLQLMMTLAPVMTTVDERSMDRFRRYEDVLNRAGRPLEQLTVQEFCILLKQTTAEIRTEWKRQIELATAAAEC